MDANETQSFPFMEALSEYYRKKNEPAQAPQGVVPLAFGDMYGAMLSGGAPGSIPFDTGAPMNTYMEHTPVQEEAAPEISTASMNGNVAGFVGSQGFKNQGVSGDPREDLSVVKQKQEEKEAAKEMIDHTPLPVEQKEEAKMELENPATYTTPIQNTDGMTPMQKLATIAMALAPAVIGYAAHGKKGAFLGAASTGKGLAAGVDQKNKEDELIAKQKKEAGNKFDKTITDQYGRQYFYDENNKLQPVIVNGEQIRKPNVPTYNPQTGLHLAKTYEDLPGETPEPAGAISMAGEMIDIGTMAEKAKIKDGAAVDPQLEAFYLKYPKATFEGPAPEGVSQRQWENIKARHTIQKDTIMKQIRGQQTESGKQKTDPMEMILARQQINNMNSYRDKTYRPAMEKIDRAQKWLSTLGNNSVENAAAYFDYMKEVQGDSSVIREGDQRTIESYFNFGTKLGQIKAVFDNKGRMSDEMKSDIKKFLSSVADFQDRKLAVSMNQFATEAYAGGEKSYRVFVSGMTPEAKSSINSYVSRQLSGKQPMSKQDIADGVASGAVGNGTMYRDAAGNIFIHTGLSRDEEYDPQTGITKKVIKSVGKPVLWRVK
jgi:hypothetical protein